MPPIDIATIRIEQNGLLVESERPLLHFAMAWSKQLRCAAFGGERIEMLPAVFLRSDYQSVVRSPIDDASPCFFGHVWKRSLRRRAAVPYFLCRSRGGIGDPDDPWMRLIRRDEESLRCVSRLGPPPHKGHALSVPPPPGIARGAHPPHRSIKGPPRHA